MVCEDDGCNRKATHLVEGQPHCQQHMLEALCSVPVSVIDLEAYEHYEHAQKKEVANIGVKQSKAS